MIGLLIKIASDLRRKRIFQYALSYALILAIVFVPTLASLLLPTSFAGQLTERSLTIGDSRPYDAGAGTGAAVDYDFEFDLPTSTQIGRWTIQFCTTASGTCTTPTGMVTTGATRDSDSFTGTGRTDNFVTNGTLDTDISTPSTETGLSDETVTYSDIRNPSTSNTTFFARITTYQTNDSTVLDTGVVASATLTPTSITVTASVDETFTFTVAGVGTTAPINGDTTDVGTSAASVPFAGLVAGTEKQAAHDVTVTTNASNGYLVTLLAGTDPPLQSGANDIDNFSGTNASPTTWSAPAGTTQNVNTGYFGYTTEDDTLCTGTAARFDGGNWAGTSAATPEEIICESGSLTGGTETTRIGWQVEVNSIAAPGTYSGVMILVATPTY